MAVYRLSWALCALLLVVAVVADEPETKTVSSVGANKEAELEKNYAASLHINPDVTEKITKKSCYDCLSMFFRTQAASSLPYFLRNKCPDFEASKRASLCRSLTNFLIMNGLMPGGEACTGVQRCNKGILKEMLKNGELKELENLVGWGDARAGKLGIWGRYGAPKDGQTGDYRHCIDDCSKISIKGIFAYNLRGIEGVTRFQDNVCAKLSNSHDRATCKLVGDYLRLNGSEAGKEKICQSIGVCDFAKPVESRAADKQQAVIRE
eukprot:TRINITY_DN311_c0_g1_i1.p1 TRINITY_DN311_c0_g1~~TRINITY_DN311_c0_g1_i1.p1  ORF type:complete len:265 (+),score=71.24 TRINITY_DN311_c0_g1_i1:217-1011(+)